jgi:chromosome segregation ATPase
MSMNNLRQVETFTSFVDFLSDPEKYRKLMMEIKQVVKQHDDAVARFKSFKDADAYKQTLDADYNKNMDALDNAKAALEDSKKNFAVRMADDEAKLVSKRQDSAKKEQAIIAREQAVSDLEKAREEVNKSRMQLEAEKVTFKKVQDDLKKREQALKAALE